MKFGIRDDPAFGGVLDNILFLDDDDDFRISEPKAEPDEY